MIDKKKMEEMRGKLVKHFDDIAAGICPVCHHPMSAPQQIRGCVYARPCGCMLYRGRIPNEPTRQGA
jgi:hypothetical protein